jgi:hypothetical protein
VVLLANIYLAGELIPAANLPDFKATMGRGSATFKVVVTSLGAFTVNQIAACMSGQSVTAIVGGVPFTGAVTNFSCRESYSMCQIDEASVDTLIYWKGYTWLINEYTGNPGPNKFLASNAFVDDDGYLHLQINKVDGVWTCAQLQTTVPLGFGTYRCVLSGRMDQLDPNIIVSMFNYGGTDYINEIDIEIAQWGDPDYGPIGYTAYPAHAGPNFNSAFPMSQTSNDTTHTFIWTPAGVNFFSQQGNKDPGDLSDPIAGAHSTVAPDIEMPLAFIVWLYSGFGPTDDTDFEVVIKDFTFTPYVEPTATKLVVIRDDGVVDETTALYGVLSTFHDRGVPATLAVTPHQATPSLVTYLNHFSTGNWEVQSTIKRAGTYALVGNPNSRNRNLRHNLEIDTTKPLLVDFYVRTTAITNPGWGGMIVAGDSQNVDLIFMHNGHFMYYDYADHNLPVDTTYKANTWYHVQVTLDFPNSLISWAIDGVSKGSADMYAGGTRDLITSLSSFTYLNLYVARAGGTTNYIDDLAISQNGVTILSDNFESGDFSNSFGIGGPWEADYYLSLERFELATCGYDSGEEDPVTTQEAARDLMISLFGKAPTSIVPPYYSVPDGFMEEARSLGYNSMINLFNYAPPRMLYTFPFSFMWEASWGESPDYVVTYRTFAEFKAAFDDWYELNQNPLYAGSNHQVFCININHQPLYNDANNPTAAQARIDFANSIDYMIGKGDVVFCTEEGAVQALGGTGIPNMETVFSDDFESADLSAWDSVGESWSNAADYYHAGTRSAKATAGASGRVLQKNITFDTSKQAVLDYYCMVSSVAGAPALCLLAGETESIEPLSMDNGHFYYYDTSEHYLPIDTTYEADTWYHLQVYLDFPNALVSWMIDGEYKGSATLRRCDIGTVVDPSIDLTALKFYNGISDATLYIDDLVVTRGNFMLPVKAHQHMR